jgi:Spy/CpxP family protein refolding chaperone
MHIVKILRRTVSLLGVALAVVLPVACPTAAQAQPARPLGPAGPAAPEYQRLGLKPDQLGRVRELHRDVNQRMRALGQQLRDQRRALEDLYGDYNLDIAKARQLNARINEIQQAILDQHLRLQTELRKILTEDQFARLRTMIDQRRQRQEDRRPKAPQ